MAVTESTNEEDYLPSSDRLPRGEVPNEADRIARSLELARAAAVTASENAAGHHRLTGGSPSEDGGPSRCRQVASLPEKFTDIST